MLSLEESNKDDSDSSDEDVSFADMLFKEEKEDQTCEGEGGVRKGCWIFTDGDGDDDSEDSTDAYSDHADAATDAEDKEEAPAPAENERVKRAAAGRKSVVKREKMALKKRVGETNKGDPPEFDP